MPNAAGHKPGQHRIATHYQVVLSDDSGEAKAIIEKALRRYSPPPPTRSIVPGTIASARRHRSAGRSARTCSISTAWSAEYRIIAGTPAEAVASLQRAHEMMGFTQLDCTFYFGGIPYEQAQRSLHLFASEVMPKLRGLA